MGNEYLYQEQAKANIETLTSVGARKIVVTCPHCFNSIKNEYPSLGGNFEVVHHSQLLDHLVSTGRLPPGRATQGPSPTTTPAISVGTTECSTSPDRCSTPSPVSARSR